MHVRGLGFKGKSEASLKILDDPVLRSQRLLFLDPVPETNPSTHSGVRAYVTVGKVS
jgi:hypothetical protein